MTRGACAYACNWSTQSVLEWGQQNSGNLPLNGLSVVAKPGAMPASVSPYGLQIDYNAASLKRLWSRTHVTTGNDGAAGAWVYLDTAVSAGTVDGLEIATIGDLYYSVVWHNDGTIRIMDSLQSTTHIQSASTYAAGTALYVAWRWSMNRRAVWLRIYDSSLNLLEDLYGVGGRFTPVNSTLLGRVAGSLTAGGLWITEFYEMAGGGLWSPLAPTFVTAFPASVSNNNADVVKGDTGTDDPANEHNYVNEAPPDDAATSYLKATDGPQHYGSGGGLVSAGDNVLAVGTTGRFWQSSSGLAVHGVQLRLSGAIHAGSAGAISGIGGDVDDVWGYQLGTFWRRDPNGNPWTVANANAVEFGHNHSIFFGGEARMSQQMLYVIHGPDSEIEDDQSFLRRAEVF